MPMVPLNNINRYWIGYVLVLALAVSLAGCSSNNGTCRGCATKTFAPDVNLKIIDRTTRQDLFFGPNALYNISLLRIKHIDNGVTDSIPATFLVDSVKHLINISLHYRAPADTVALLVGSLKPRLLVLYTGILNSCCARVVVSEAHYQDSLIYMAPTDAAHLAKAPNLVTVPFY